MDYQSSGVNIELGDDASKILYEAAKFTWENRKGRLGAVVEMFGGFDREPKAEIHGVVHVTGGGIPGKLGRVLKPSGTIWSFIAASSKDGKVPIAFEFAKIMEEYFQVDYRNWVVWARQKGRSASKYLKSQREDLFYATKHGVIRLGIIFKC